MLLIKKTAQLGKIIAGSKQRGRTIGFVPTMGALHDGHISLVRKARSASDITVCSIFVNPAQFNNKSDLEKYPVTIEKDIDQLEKSDCDILFLPDEAEIYPPGYKADYYELGFLDKVLEGEFRPGHFQGVCQVVDRLLQMVQPDLLFLGQKDYQQCMVINKLISLKHASVQAEIVETVRESDGLAMSSRNLRLNDSQRKKAATIYAVLTFIKHNLGKKDLTELSDTGKDMLMQKGLRIDYLTVADAEHLEEVRGWDGKKKIVALVAAYLDEIRLIDNIALN